MNTTQATIKRSNPNALSANLAGKLLVFTLAATLAMAFLLAGASKAFSAPLPRTQVLVRDADIRLGDVFEGVAQHADFVLAPAPKPGEELVWNAPTLMRIATAFNLPWRPQNHDAVHIRRAASLIDAETLKLVLREHLASSNADDTYNISFSSDVPEVIVPGLETPDVQVTDFSMPAQGGTFSAIIKVAAGTNGKDQTITLRGMAERIVRVPVLRSSLRNGTVISESDITWVTRPAISVRQNVLRDTGLLIGSTPRKTIGAGSFISADDLQQPLMVSRGDAITLVYSKNGMYLTTKGRALEDGTMGQTIKVSNLSSSRQLEGRISATKEVTVQ